MRVASRVVVTAFAKPEEDAVKIRAGLLSLFPFEAKIVVSKVQGFNGRIILKFEVLLTKESDINKFLKHFFGLLSDQQRSLLEAQAGSRLDECFNFFIRVDKTPWVERRKLFLTDSGDCIHIRISLAVFPSKKELALDLIKGLLKKDFYSSRH